MSLKGSNTTSDYIPYEKVIVTGQRLLKEKKIPVIGLYLIVSANMGLRAGDILKLRWHQLKDDLLEITEQKTGKRKIIKLNDVIKDALKSFSGKDEEYVFLSQKNTPYSIQSINRILKDIFAKEAKKLNVSSHSIRKAFGRRVYENKGESEHALVFLSELFNHSSPAVTRKYLGIRQTELNDIYDCLV
jgi:integrase